MEKKNVAIILLAIALVASGVGNIILGIMTGFLEVEAPEAKILTYVDTATPYVLDPVDCWDAYSGLIIEQSAEPLFTYNYSNNGQNIALIGALATSYTYDDSGAEAFYDITLRQGVTFHDVNLGMLMLPFGTLADGNTGGTLLDYYQVQNFQGIPNMFITLPMARLLSGIEPKS
jgi:ABC-type transport system substrate-binding protein